MRLTINKCLSLLLAITSFTGSVSVFSQPAGEFPPLETEQAQSQAYAPATPTPVTQPGYQSSVPPFYQPGQPGYPPNNQTSYPSGQPSYPPNNQTSYPPAFPGIMNPVGSYPLPATRYSPQSLYSPYRTLPPQLQYKTPNYQFSRISPFGNSFSPTSIFNNGNFPTPWTNASLWNPWANGNNNWMPFLPEQDSDKKKAWGEERNIWPDFYTDFTSEAWDKSINAPYDAGRMPGGWRAPSLSSPDPVTVGDAVINQFPPMMEEMGNMMDFSN